MAKQYDGRGTRQASRRRALGLGLVAIAVVVPVAALAQAGASTPQQGYRAAAKNCAVCHAIEGAADSPDPGAPPFREIGRRYDATALPRRLQTVTEQGHYAMPPRHLTSSDRDAIAAYIVEATERAWRN